MNDWETEEEFDDLIDQWHESDSDVDLFEWLGLTWHQWSLFLKSSSQDCSSRDSYLKWYEEKFEEGS